MADVFISYHRSEGASALVRRIAGELESRGVSCWYDTKNKAPVDFIHLILTEINACKVFLFLWDEESNKEPFYVRREIHTAASAGNVTLFPFRVGDFELNPVLKFYFGPLNILYGGNSPETARVEELAEVIADMLGKAPAPQQKSKPSAQIPPPKPVPTPPKEEPKLEPKPIMPPMRIIKHGKCGRYGNNVNYTLENGVLLISGKGAMQDFKWDNRTHKSDAPWWNEREMISHVEIQNGVTTIGVNAFSCCVKLTSVIIPESVIDIGYKAFEACYELTSVSVPAKTHVDSNAFLSHFRVKRRFQNELSPPR